MLQLYSYYRSSCSWRVRIALNLKGLEYEIIPINLLKGEQRSQAYRTICPNGLIPSLRIDDGLLLSQSVAILEYLEEAYPIPNLLPKDIIKRQKVRQLMGMIASDIQPIQNLRVLKEVEQSNIDKVEWAKKWVVIGFEAVEAELLHCSGRYCVGDEITLADVVLVPQVYNAKRFNVDLSKFPQISGIHDRLCMLEEFISASPEQQPDFVK